ncbi:MAG: ComEC/Rec2 family competence protein, partial [Burkholderiales bacterium]|nr:ComEC/Rec2 family competence protein [Burkholderiales bacterium]
MTGRATGGRITLAVLAWLAGIALQLQQPALWPVAAYGAMCGAAALAALLAWRWPPFALWIVLAAAGLGAGQTGLRAHAVLADALPPALEGRDLLLTGVVASLPQASAAGTRFQFDVEAASSAGRPVAVPTHVALGWYVDDGDDNPRADLRAGQRWRLPVRLKQPHGALNPDGFDVELWWWEQGLRATGFVRAVRAGPQPELLADNAGHPIERLRQHIRDAIQRQVSDPRLAGVLAALAVGDQAAIEREDWALFRNTGIAHLMSISGLHITMFAWAAGGAIGWAWRRSPRAMLSLPAQRAGRWGGLIVATAYALIAGWGVPAERTLLMLACGVLLTSAGARWPWLLVLGVAGVLVTLFDPWALLQAGFWLSFAAVGLLLASEAAQSEPAQSGWRTALRGQLRSQWVASAGLAPLSMVFFQQISIVGLLANLIAIPLVTLVITPLTLLGVLVTPLWHVAAAVVQAMVLGLGWLASWPLAVWTAPAAPAWAIASGLLGALVGVMPLPRALRWLAIPLVLPLLWPPVQRPAEGRIDIVLADVGQGTAVLVRTRGHLLVYDTGPQYSR